VIARDASAAYQSKPVDIREIGEDLGVGYVLEGSIQLIDARTGAHAWSERWDRPAQDVFAVQSEIAEQVASTLGESGMIIKMGRAPPKASRPPVKRPTKFWTWGN
jgi:TolB-like protein